MIEATTAHYVCRLRGDTSTYFLSTSVILLDALSSLQKYGKGRHQHIRKHSESLEYLQALFQVLRQGWYHDITLLGVAHVTCVKIESINATKNGCNYMYMHAHYYQQIYVHVLVVQYWQIESSLVARLCMYMCNTLYMYMYMPHLEGMLHVNVHVHVHVHISRILLAYMYTCM